LRAVSDAALTIVAALPEHLVCAYPAFPPPTDVPLTVLPEHDCPYLPPRRATTRGLLASRIPADLYHDFLDAGFRRSGKLIYQPICRGCRQCVPIRVLVDRFQPSKSQRRCFRRNADLIVSCGPAKASAEKQELYRRYVTGWHGGESAEGFESFLYDSPVETIEFCYRDPAGRLLAVGICDLSRRSLSSVYFYFDPADAWRGLGTFGVLYELGWAGRSGIPFYYLGYWIHGCGTMKYKANFRPFELLLPDGNWREAAKMDSL
jgi:arginine-tRNA-protein transferase